MEDKEALGPASGGVLPQEHAAQHTQTSEDENADAKAIGEKARGQVSHVTAEFSHLILEDTTGAANQEAQKQSAIDSSLLVNMD